MKLHQCNRRRFRSIRRYVAQVACAAIAIIEISGCATTRTADVSSLPEPRGGAVRAFDTKRPVVALVLSGGSARGFAHIGVIRVLEQMGIEPDLIVGTSAGSIVGAGYAAGMTADQLAEAAKRFDKWLFLDFAFPNIGLPLIAGELGFIRGEKLQQFVDDLVGRRPIESLPRRFAVTATDLRTGKTALFTHGCTGLAVRASSSVPGVFSPPLIGGQRYVDGQVSSPVPVMAARALGADIVIAVDTTYPPDHAEISSTVDVLFQSFMIAGQRIKDRELGLADVVIRPDIKTTGQLGFDDRDWIVKRGEAAARAMASELRKATRSVAVAHDERPP